MLDHTPEPEIVRRLEVITGTGQRWRFSKDDKARIVEETLAPGAAVSEVARRHGLSPPQLFGWRRQARQPLEATAGEDARLFVPVVVDARARCRPRGRNRTLAHLARASMPPLRRYGFTATAAKK
ncbi:MAG TPA: transposase [Pseudolabrys sp.]